jgi:hypothetical protein
VGWGTQYFYCEGNRCQVLLCFMEECLYAALNAVLKIAIKINQLPNIY